MEGWVNPQPRLSWEWVLSPGPVAWLSTALPTELSQPDNLMYHSNMENIPYPRRNGFSTNWPVQPIVTQNQRCYIWSIWLLPKWLSTSQISFQIKHRAKINIGMRFNTNLRRKMTHSICLTTGYRNENTSMTLKKKVLNKWQKIFDILRIEMLMRRGVQ